MSQRHEDELISWELVRVVPMDTWGKSVLHAPFTTVCKRTRAPGICLALLALLDDLETKLIAGWTWGHIHRFVGRVAVT